MIRSPGFAKDFLSSAKDPITNEISFPDASSLALNALKYYISNECLPLNLLLDQQEDLSLQDLLVLCQIAFDYKIKGLYEQCFGKIEPLVLTANAQQHQDSLLEILSMKAAPDSFEEKKRKLSIDYIFCVFQQNNITYQSNLTKVALPLQNIYLLSQSNAFAKILKPYISVLALVNLEDLNCLAELHLLPDKVKNSIKELHIKQIIPLATFQKLVQHFPNIEGLAITIDPVNHTPFFDAIAELTKIQTLKLIVPKKVETEEAKNPPLVTEYKMTFAQSANPAMDIINTTIDSISNTISKAFPPNVEPVSFAPTSKFFDALKNNIKYLEVTEKCRFIIPEGIHRLNIQALFYSKVKIMGNDGRFIVMCGVWIGGENSIILSPITSS